MINALTVDVEDWFQVSALQDHIRYEEWDRQESRVVQNTVRVLRIFEEYQVKATFFVLGWIAERYPEIVRTIKKYGHEVGSHGYSHKIIYENSRDEFKRDIDKSLKILQDITGEPITCYRAPSFSISRSCMWALQELSDRGIQSDSSIFPIKHDIGGMPDMPRVPFFLKFKNGNRLDEFPLSTVELWGRNLPISGGGYLRLLPYWFIRNGIRRNNRLGIPVVFYFHPWELDPGQPRLDLSFTSRFRHYTNLELTEGRIHSLLREFKFSTLGQLGKTYNIDYQWPQFTVNGNGHQ